jgi:hypothetical protein
MVASAASMMTRATVPGLVIKPRCPALISVMWACARWAMNSNSAGGMARSAVPITTQDGMFFQAGGPGGFGKGAESCRSLGVGYRSQT